MATATTTTPDVQMVTGLFYDRDSAERAYQSIVSRGYDNSEVNVVMAEETRKRLFPEDGLVTDLGTKAAEAPAELGDPAGGTMATVSTAVSAIAAAGALLLLPGLGLVAAGPIAAAITGAATAGIAGGVIGVLSHWGIPDARREEYESGIKRGGILLGVKPHTDADARYFEQQWKVNYGTGVRA